MSIKLLMPALSPTMTEGILGRWLKQEGEQVEPGDVIAEIETDKATMEFEAIDSGILAKILVPGNTEGVKVNSIIAILAEEGEDINEVANSILLDNPSTETVKNISTKQSQIEQVKQSNNDSRIFVSPLAKNIATQNEINLSQVIGSGPYGRIIKDDVLAIIDKKVSQIQAVERPVINHTAAVINHAPVVQGGQSDLVPISNMRKVIAQRLLESKTTIPHFYLTVECNVSEFIQFREEINFNYTKINSTKKISVNDMIIRATGIALGEIPAVNTSWGGDKIIQLSGVDISVAVAVDDGLITPIVKDVNQKSLSVISDEVKSLVKRAKEGKLRPDEFQGGSISISNLGMYNIDSFLAIINPPQSCIISVGGITKKPIVIQDEIIIGSMMSISISCDHRVIDGALAAQFINKIKNYLENPLSLV
jgi:pyruvate dehydrogenase E2 component (dihydrolipoamide acetyltransferase)